MKKSKSNILLEAFSKNELKSFDKFLSYCLNGKAEDIRNYWEAKYSRNKNTLNNVPAGSYSRKTLSDFNKRIEKFYILKGMEKDDTSKILFLSRELRRRNIYKYYGQVLNYLKEVKSKTPANNPRNRLNLLNLNFEKYLYYNRSDDYKNLYKTSTEENEITEIIILRSILFKYFNEIYYGGKDSFSDAGLIKIKDVITKIETNSEDFKNNYPNVWILYLLYKITENFLSAEYVNSLVEYLQENDRYIEEEFFQFSYDSLFELLTKTMASGGTNVRENFQRIFIDIEKRGILKRLNHIRPRYFPLFTAFILESKDVYLAEKFISEYKSKLINIHQNEVLNLCIARIEFSKGNYNKVMELIKDMKSNDPILYIQHKIILLKTYYEKDELRYIYTLTDTIKHYLKRKSLNNQPVSIITDFINCYNKLIYSKNHHGKGLEYIKTMISSDKFFIQKKWISEKYQELKAVYENRD